MLEISFLLSITLDSVQFSVSVYRFFFIYFSSKYIAMKELGFNLLFFFIATLLQISCVGYVRKLEFKTVALGTVLFVIALTIQLLEVYHPPDVMKWILFWSNMSGRGIFLCFLSLIAMNGLLFTGIISLCLSFGVLLSPIVFQSYEAPKCLYENYVGKIIDKAHESYGSVIQNSEGLNCQSSVGNDRLLECVKLFPVQ